MSLNEPLEYPLSTVLKTLEAGSRPRGGVDSESGEVPSIGGENITSDGNMTYASLKRVPRDFFLSMPRGHLSPMDVLINKDGAQTGKVSVYSGEFAEAAINEHVFLLRGKPDVLDQLFLYYYLLWEKSRQQIARVVTGSAQPGINTKFADHVRIHIFPLPEQRRIAEILDTADEAIRQTERLIAKLKAVKAGLLHDLLTRGLDAHGHLRDPQAHPEQFKDSPLGKIPKTWDVVSLSDEIEILHGYAFKGEYFADTPPGEVLLVPGNFHREGGLYFNEHNTKYYRGPIPEGTVLENGDILIVMTDLSPRTLILGRVVELWSPFPVLHNQRIGKIVLKCHEAWDKRFFVASMNSDRVRHNIIRTASGTTVRHTSPDRIVANLVPKPDKQEQEKIASILDAHDARIHAEEAALVKLRQVKRGLMDDLLTGRVRVA